MLEPITFVDRLQEVPVILEPSNFAFPLPGVYQLTLDVDGDYVAHRLVHVF